MKYEWKKSEKESYIPKAVPTLINVPSYKFFIIRGRGDPNGDEFANNVGALYTMSYAVRMMPKNGFTPDGYFEYTVYPLEGVWSGDALDKSSFEYEIMIRQPNFVNEVVFIKALEIANNKKPSPALQLIKFENREDGHCVQMMHIGPYDTEPISFAVMNDYLISIGLSRRTKTHREIYLSDPSTSTPETQKTVLRYYVK